MSVVCFFKFSSKPSSASSSSPSYFLQCSSTSPFINHFLQSSSSIYPSSQPSLTSTSSTSLFKQPSTTSSTYLSVQSSTSVETPTPSLSPPQSTTTSSSVLPSCSCNSSVLFTGSTSQSVSSNNQPVSSNSLKIFYFNACSLFPKLDDLSSLCSIHSPNLVCIVESWLSSVITNLDIALNNYYLFHRDRNRHGRGIVIYIRSHLIVLEIPLPSAIELLSVKCKHCSLTVGTYY